eukprot:Phypoly_transcript_11455.p1 GENE.Phypoly_transcript_11455~~Phypoly_transcript_11455.p1  ORF type:complete len:369 (-),score=48.76 Phypoly_transcript_11455:28-1134(-)
MSADYKFFGWLGKDKDSINGKLVWEEYIPKTWTEADVDIKVTHCGVCASDLHTLRSGWSPSDYPVCVGHEIIGHVVKVGKNVTHLKIGDRVGVGAQSDSCHKCDLCNSGEEIYCEDRVGTYNARYPDKSKSYGGYANYSRVNSTFAFKIPDNIPSEIAAPMLCAGTTVYSPLRYHGAGKTAKHVGIVGIGGLGHFGLLFASALGAEVYAISTSDSKKADAESMGAKHFIATKNDIKGAFKPYLRKLDLIIVTINDEKMPLNEYISLLKPRSGKLILVGIPEKPILFNPFPLLMSGTKGIGASHVGGSVDINEMLQLAATQNIQSWLAATQNIKSWVQTRPLRDANQVILDMDAGKARYRYVLVNDNSL